MREGSLVRSLTGIRGLAAMWVVLLHGTTQLMPDNGIARLPFIAKGYLAVDLFFVLSGFVLVMSSQRSFSADFGLAVRRFYIGRVFRVYPLNIVTLLAAGGLCWILPQCLAP